MQDVLVIGANRGLGLGFVQALLTRGCRVTATVRAPRSAGMLSKMAAAAPLELLQLDVVDAASRERFHRDMASRAVDTVVQNAGIYGPRGLMPGDLPDEAWREVLHVDTVAPFLVVQGLLPQLREAAKHGKPAAIHFLSSKMGSIADNGSGGSYLYRSAKAGLNAAARSLALDLASDGIRVQLLHPGWVRTEMGSDRAPLGVEESVAGMVARMTELEMDQSGRFVDWSGEEIPW